MARGGASACARLLAGIETGIIGGIVMLLYYSSLAILQRQHWWSFVNLLGSAVYGHVAIWKGLGRATLAGAAVQLLLAAACGILFSFLLSVVRLGALFRFSCAIAVAIGWYFLLYTWILPGAAPLIPLYASPATCLVAHVLLGVALSRANASFERISRFLQTISIGA